MAAFQEKQVYKASNGRKFKCIAVDAVKATFAPMYGCVVYAKKAFARKVRVNPATKRPCVKVNANSSECVWLTA